MVLSCTLRTFSRYLSMIFIYTFSQTGVDKVVANPKLAVDKFVVTSFLTAYDFSYFKKHKVVKVRYCGRCPLVPLSYGIRRQGNKVIVTSKLLMSILENISSLMINSLVTCGSAEPHVATIIQNHLQNMYDDPFGYLAKYLKEIGAKMPPSYPIRAKEYIVNGMGAKVEPVNVCARQCFSAAAPAVPSNWHSFMYVVDTDLLNALVTLPPEYSALIIAKAMALNPKILEFLKKADDMKEFEEIANKVHQLASKYRIDVGTIANAIENAEKVRQNTLLRFVSNKLNDVGELEIVEMKELISQIKKELTKLRKEIKGEK